MSSSFIDLEAEERLDAVYSFVSECISDNGYPPSVREICKYFNVTSTSMIHNLLKKLESRNLISIGKNLNRAMTLVSDSKFNAKDILESHVRLPILGEVTAGTPIFAYEDNWDSVLYPKALLNQFSSEDSLFALDVKGNSMIDAGICDKDRVIVKNQSYAKNGDIVVALINDDYATIKRFYKEIDHFRLHPENKNLKDIIVNDCQILGIVIGLIRVF